MKIGSIDITKAYYGEKELTHENCFVGVLPLIEGETKRYITFTSTEDGSTVGLSQLSRYQTMEYSLDAETWENFSTPITITIDNNKEAYIRGILSKDNTSLIDYSSNFAITGKVSISGNINALWNYEDLTAPLKKYCGYNLFSNCNGLVDISNLVFPATSLSECCYFQMFANCRNLITSPRILPAMDLSNVLNGYISMFQGCTSLTTAPELPATTLAEHCYDSMFLDCTSLTTAPELPATNISSYCYYQMFRGCTSLTTAPELPDTTLVSYCYDSMFYGCTSLTTAPDLPATKLGNESYHIMFYGCTSLTTAPEILPATALTNSCYWGMFYGCTSLTTAPELPATTLNTYCYRSMFEGCSSLNYIKCLAVNNINPNYSTNQWVNGVSATGVFVQNSSTTAWGRGKNGIPNGWAVEYFVDTDNYITFNGHEENSSISLNKISKNQKLWYSNDSGETWNDFTTGNTFTLNNDETLCVCGFLSSGNSATNSDYTNFNITGNVSVNGDLNSLWNYKNLNKPLYQYCGYGLFSGCTGLVEARGLTLGTSATTLADNCYTYMFYDCTNLTTSPEILPATVLKEYCYHGMFQNCSNLTTSPELPATSLTKHCYSSMFGKCTSLTVTPELPATTLENYCYYQMFSGCTSLTTSSEIPATKLNFHDCQLMFYGCTSLINGPTILPATGLSESCYSSMFRGCTSLTTAPELPARFFYEGCYKSMFNGCTSLNYIKCLANDVVVNDYTNNWVNNVAPTGTFIANPNASWPRGVDGVPNEWTITCIVNVSYFSNHGNVPQTKTVFTPYTLTSEDLPTLTESGYAFIGWDKQVGDVITNNTLITCFWTPIEITYDSLHGITPQSKFVTFPHTLTSEDLPTLTDSDYTFIGWDKQTGETIELDTTITAEWEHIIEYKSTVKLDTNFTKKAISHTYNDNIGVLTYINLLTLPEKAFYSCTTLQEITIPDFIIEIGNSAFLGCTGLTSLEIPSSVTSIGETPFTNCTCKIKFNKIYSSFTNPLFAISTTTYTLEFNINSLPSGYNISTILPQGTGNKKNLTYNIYTDYEPCKDQAVALAGSYTIVNVYHIDGTPW